MAGLKAKEGQIPEVDETTGKLIWGRDENGKPVCWAKHLRDQTKRCMSRTTHMNGRCKMHGGTKGKKTGGVVSSQWKDGKYSSVAGELGRKITAMSKRTDLLELSQNIAMLTQLQLRRIEELEDGWTSELLDKLGRAASYVSQNIGRVRQYVGRGDLVATEVLRSVQEMCEDILEKQDQRKAVNEILVMEEQIRKNVETEQKRLKDAKMMVRADQLKSVLIQLDSIMLDEGFDPVKVAKVWRRMSALQVVRSGESEESVEDEMIGAMLVSATESRDF